MFEGFLAKALGTFMATSFGLGSLSMPFFNIGFKIPEKPLATGPGVTRFESCTALKNQISKAQTYGRGMMYGDLAVTGMPMMAQKSAAPTSAVAGEAAGGDYSKTNVQVEGVDEADIIKIGDKIDAQGFRYVYHLTKNRLAVSVVEPGYEAANVSVTDFKDMNASDLYVLGDRVMVIGTKYENNVYPMPLTTGVTSLIARPSDNAVARSKRDRG